jgi:hypothetical protein
MALHRTSDHLSRCDQNLYSDLYHVGNRRKPSKVEAVHFPKDSIEISHEKLKADALNRLRHSTDSVIAQNSFMRIGKYLFLAIAFPPYIIIYGLPKWIVVEAIPAIFLMMTIGFNKTKRAVKKPADFLFQKALEVAQFMKEITQRLISPFIHMANGIRNSFRKMHQSVSFFMQKILKRTKDNLDSYKTKLKGGRVNLRSRLAQILKKTSHASQKFRKALLESSQWLQQSLSLINLGKGVIQKFNRQKSSWVLAYKNKSQLSQERAKRATLWLNEQLKVGGDKLLQFFKPLTSFYQKQLLPQYKALKAIDS